MIEYHGDPVCDTCGAVGRAIPYEGDPRQCRSCGWFVDGMLRFNLPPEDLYGKAG